MGRALGKIRRKKDKMWKLTIGGDPIGATPSWRLFLFFYFFVNWLIDDWIKF